MSRPQRSSAEMKKQTGKKKEGGNGQKITANAVVLVKDRSPALGMRGRVGLVVAPFHGAFSVSILNESKPVFFSKGQLVALSVPSVTDIAELWQNHEGLVDAEVRRVTGMSAVGAES